MAYIETPELNLINDDCVRETVLLPLTEFCGTHGVYERQLRGVTVLLFCTMEIKNRNQFWKARNNYQNSQLV